MNKRLFHAITTITFGGPKRTYSDWYNADTLRQAMRMHRAETNDASPYHLTGDCLGVIGDPRWDLVICHPPCTHLAVSGAHLFTEKIRDGRQQEGVAFFMRCVNEPRARFLCVENPVSIMSTIYRKPDQIIQPYQFGHDASKKTCLWLRGRLPLLMPTQHVPPRLVNGRPRWSNQTDSGQNNLSPSKNRAAIRARTYPGIADAMAQQWGALTP